LNKHNYITTADAVGLVKHYYENKMWLDEYEHLMISVKELEKYENQVEFEKVFLLLVN